MFQMFQMFHVFQGSGLRAQSSEQDPLPTTDYLLFLSFMGLGFQMFGLTELVGCRLPGSGFALHWLRPRSPLVDA
jgi:hypothetical protein